MARYTLPSILAALVVGAIIGALAGAYVPDAKWSFFGTVAVGVIASLIGGWPLDGKGLNLELGHPAMNAPVSGGVCAATVLALLRFVA